MRPLRLLCRRRSIGSDIGGGARIVRQQAEYAYILEQYTVETGRRRRRQNTRTSKGCGASTAPHPLDESRFHLFRSTRGALPYELILPLACRTEGNWSYASGSRFSAADAIAS